MIEMLIVISIVGILGVAVAGVTKNQSEAARRVGTQDTVFQTSQAIALFRERTGVLPDLIGAGWEPLVSGGTYNGRTVGPLIAQAPRNLMIPSGGNPSCIADGNVPVLYIDQCSFLYDYAGGAGTGRFIGSYAARPRVRVDVAEVAEVRESMGMTAAAIAATEE